MTKNFISLENKFCIYCRGILELNSRLNYHQGCHTDVKKYKLTLNPYSIYSLSDKEAEILLQLEEHYGSQLPDLSFGKVYSSPIGFAHFNGELTGISFTKPIKLNDFNRTIGKLKNLFELNISGMKLGEFPKISWMNIIDKQDFCLATLNLAKNNIDSVPKSIGLISKLRELNLDFNLFDEFPIWIRSLQHLQILSLKNNKIATIHSSFDRISLLNELNLHGNHLEFIPKSIGNIKGLKKLDLSSNRLKNLPDVFNEFFRLKNVKLNQNKLRFLPTSLTTCPDLTYLKLDQNQLGSLPESIGNLSRLKSLSVNFNQLNSLPESIVNLKHLRGLYLSNNNLHQLPNRFQELKKLIYLNLSFNQLQKFPSGLIHLKSLKRLSLTANKLHNIPNEIINLENLEHLDLARNQYSQFPVMLATFHTLRDIDLSYNKITSLPKFSDEIVNDQHQGQLNQIKFDINHDINLLTHLNLSRNRFKDTKSLPIEFFNRFPSLNMLYIDTPSLLPDSLYNNEHLKIINTHEFYKTQGHRGYKKPISHIIIDNWFGKL